MLSVYGEAESGKRSDQLKLARTERSKTADDFFNGHVAANSSRPNNRHAKDLSRHSSVSLRTIRRAELEPSDVDDGSKRFGHSPSI